MSTGAASVAPRLCSKAGCDRPARGRGMCHKHWTQWARANPDVRQEPTTQKTVLDSLPGHSAQLVEATGLCQHSVGRALKILKDGNLAHIGSWEPPTTKGTKWKAVWVAGPGKDARLTNKMRHAQECKSNRQSYARRRAGASWAGPILGV